MIAGLFAALLLLPWLATGLLLWRSDDQFRYRRSVMITIAVLIAAGSMGLAWMDTGPSMAFGAPPDLTESATMADRWAWSADRFSLVIVAALMIMLAAVAVLLPDESPTAWLLTVMISGALLPLWWSQSVWAIAGVSVGLSLLTLILPAVISPVATPAVRTLWLTTTVGDCALVMAIVAGVGGLGTAAAASYGDPHTVREFATMRTATGMFVALWSWLGVLCRAGQFPWCVNFDAVRSFRPTAWVLAVGVGVFAVGHRWCDLYRGWWAASPPMTNLILSAAVVSALLCAWFAICTPDLRVRIAYLTTAHFSLALGPLTTGADVDRVWAAAVMLGSLSAALWFWCVLQTPLNSNDDRHRDSTPGWAQILTGGSAANVTWTFSFRSQPTPPPVLPVIPPSARGMSAVMVLVWCALSIAAGSWWWSDEPVLEKLPATSVLEPSNAASDTMTELTHTRPKGRVPVSTIAVMIVAAAMATGTRAADRRASSDHQTGETSLLAGIVLGFVPVGLIVLLARADLTVVPIVTACSPALGCLVLAAMVTGWVCAGWPEPQREKLTSSLAVVRHIGEGRLLIPGLLRFGANFPLRGLAQLFRFLDWSVVERGCWAQLRQLPETLRRYRDELRPAGQGSDSLIVLMSGAALVATIVWLAQTSR